MEGKHKTMSFEELLLEAIDEGLSLLGESPKAAIYFHLEKTFSIKRQDIPYKIEEFTNAIERMFGVGAKIVEIRIMKILFKKVGCTFKSYWKPANLEFREYIATIKSAKNNCYPFKTQQPNLSHNHNTKKILIRLS
jgi:hypothetical protein